MSLEELEALMANATRERARALTPGQGDVPPWITVGLTGTQAEIELYKALAKRSQEIINLVKAAKQHGCGYTIGDPRVTSRCRLCEAIAAFEEKK